MVNYYLDAIFSSLGITDFLEFCVQILTQISIHLVHPFWVSLSLPDLKKKKKKKYILYL